MIMNTFWLTLIEINLILSVVYLGYILLLKNLTFFRWIRVYLFGGMLLGLVYPFLKSQKVVTTPPQSVSVSIPDFSVVNSSFDYGLWAVYGVSTVFIVLFLRFMVRFLSLRKIHSHSEKASFNGTEYRDTIAPTNPFSFWKWIYIHRISHSDPEMRQILSHEQIHVQERHSLDVILAEICSIICWYNPLIKLLSRAVKDNLEFLVDADLVQSGIDRVSYQHSLVGVSLSGLPSTAYGNEFAFKTLKRRIKMMNTERSSKLRLSSFIILTPILLGIAGWFTFSCQRTDYEVKDEMEYSTRVSLESNQSEELLKKSLTLYFLDGERISHEEFEAIDVETIQKMSVLKGDAALAEYGEKGKHGVVLVETK